MNKKYSTHITKWTLCKTIICPIATIGLGFGGAFFLIFQIITLVVDDPLGWSESIWFGFRMWMFMFSFITGVGSIKPLNGLLRLGTQEKIMNFSFSDEMKKNNITQTEYINDQWFVSAKDAAVLVFRRDYIREIKEVIDVNDTGLVFIVVIVTADNREVRIKGLAENITAKDDWYLEKQK
jgi:hypothetical protein